MDTSRSKDEAFQGGDGVEEEEQNYFLFFSHKFGIRKP